MTLDQTVPQQKIALPATRPKPRLMLKDGIKKVLGSHIAPDLVGFMVSQNDVTALLSRRTKAPRGFRELNDGYAWRFHFSDPPSRKNSSQGTTPPPSVEVLLHSYSAMHPSVEPPLFMYLGQSGRSDVLLNLSHVRHLSLRGSPDDVDEAMSSLATDILSNPTRSDVQICMVGFGEDLEMFPQVAVFDKLSEVWQTLRAVDAKPQSAKLPKLLQLLSSGEQPLAMPARRPDIIVFAPTAESPELLSKLARLNVFLVTSCDVAPWMLELGERANRLHPLDISLTKRSPQAPTLASEKLTERARLLPVAKRQRLVDDTAPRSGRVRVCVLGPVEVEGIKSQASQQCMDFICYLAFHREGVTADMVTESFWRDKIPPPNQTITSLASRSRALLGKGRHNQPLLPRIRPDNTYHLSSEVTTDYDEFCRHMRRARHESVASMIHLRRALQLVRGAPFSGPNHHRYKWADLFLRVHMECLIDEVAHRLADIALKFSDPETARWACYQAHKVIPGCEQCYLRRFRVAYMEKNRVELQSAMSELHQIVSAEQGCQISGHMLEIYLQLLEQGNWGN